MFINMCCYFIDMYYCFHANSSSHNNNNPMLTGQRINNIMEQHELNYRKYVISCQFITSTLTHDVLQNFAYKKTSYK